jgi:hypothetical protein
MVIAVMVGTGCGEEATPCPQSIESFCAYEFGGPCPTFEEAAAMTCDGYHFDVTGGGTPPSVSEGGASCSDPIVSCTDPDDPNLRTRMYFFGTGSSKMRVVDLIWPSSDGCTIDTYFGDAVC